MSSQEPDNSGLTAPVDTPQPPDARRRRGRPGAQLLAERRAQGLSLGDVARQLKLSVRQVEALERDEYAAFPGPVFVRGFLRNYAKLLQLDPEALVAQAAISAAPSASAGASIPLTPVPLHESGGGRRSRFGFGTLALGLVLVIVAVAAIYDARNKPAPVSLSSGPAHAERPGRARCSTPTPRPLFAGRQRDAGAHAGGSGDGSRSNGHDGLSASGGRPLRQRLTPPPTPPANRRPAWPRSNSSFDDESWVEIKDGTGAVIFSRLNPPAAEQVVSGEPPSRSGDRQRAIGAAHLSQTRASTSQPHTRVDVARVRLE